MSSCSISYMFDGRNLEKIQLAQQIAGPLDKVNNTSLKKHQLGRPRRACDFEKKGPGAKRKRALLYEHRSLGKNAEVSTSSASCWWGWIASGEKKHGLIQIYQW